MAVLNQSWKNCRRMWKWVSENLPEEFSKIDLVKKEEVIRKLKAKWLKDNRFTKRISQDCFFCEYDKQHGNLCMGCPAVLIEPNFHCDDPEQSFRFEPIKFYIRILELDIRRRETQ